MRGWTGNSSGSRAAAVVSQISSHWPASCRVISVIAEVSSSDALAMVCTLIAASSAACDIAPVCSFVSLVTSPIALEAFHRFSTDNET